MDMKTKVTEMLGIQYPIIQGGMQWVWQHGILRLRLWGHDGGEVVPSAIGHTPRSGP